MLGAFRAINQMKMRGDQLVERRLNWAFGLFAAPARAFTVTHGMFQPLERAQTPNICAGH
jgi:hypothetical protein